MGKTAFNSVLLQKGIELWLKLPCVQICWCYFIVFFKFGRPLLCFVIFLMLPGIEDTMRET